MSAHPLIPNQLQQAGNQQGPAHNDCEQPGQNLNEDSIGRPILVNSYTNTTVTVRRLDFDGESITDIKARRRPSVMRMPPWFGRKSSESIPEEAKAAEGATPEWLKRRGSSPFSDKFINFFRRKSKEDIILEGDEVPSAEHVEDVSHL
jgi:hypothetical protein